MLSRLRFIAEKAQMICSFEQYAEATELNGCLLSHDLLLGNDTWSSHASQPYKIPAWDHTLSSGNVILSTVRCRYNAVNFLLPNPHNRHPIARPWGRAMGCLLWFWSLIYVLLLPLQCRWQYRDKLGGFITALDCFAFCCPALCKHHANFHLLVF